MKKKSHLQEEEDGEAVGEGTVEVAVEIMEKVEDVVIEAVATREVATIIKKIEHQKRWEFNNEIYFI